MKSLSAAVVVLAGMLPFSASGLISHDDTQLFYGLCGGGIAALGLYKWIQLLQTTAE